MPLLKDLAVMAGVAVLAAIVLGRLRIPSVAGLLLEAGAPAADSASPANADESASAAGA